MQHFLKILPADPELVMHNFWAQNGPFLQNLMGGGGGGGVGGHGFSQYMGGAWEGA